MMGGMMMMFREKVGLGLMMMMFITIFAGD
jgi:hypothetical protein